MRQKIEGVSDALEELFVWTATNVAALKEGRAVRLPPYFPCFLGAPHPIVNATTRTSSEIREGSHFPHASIGYMRKGLLSGEVPVISNHRSGKRPCPLPRLCPRQISRRSHHPGHNEPCQSEQRPGGLRQIHPPRSGHGAACQEKSASLHSAAGGQRLRSATWAIIGRKRRKRGPR